MENTIQTAITFANANGIELSNIIRKGKHAKPVQDALLSNGFTKEDVKEVVNHYRAKKDALQIARNEELARVQRNAENADETWKREGFQSRGAWAVANAYCNRTDGGTNGRRK